MELRISENIKKHHISFKHDLLQNKYFENYTVSMNNPLSVQFGTAAVSWENKAPDANIFFNGIFTDHDFVKTFKIKLKAGRDFSSLIPGDKNNFIINEEAAKMMNLKKPVGNRVRFGPLTGEIIGLVCFFLA